MFGFRRAPRQPSSSPEPAPASSRAGPGRPKVGGKGVGLGKGKGAPPSSRPAVRGIGRGIGKTRRHKKVLRDSIQGITKGDIRRLARRGGVKRISAQIYEDIRGAMKEYLRGILCDCAAVVDYAGRKTVTTMDICFVLKKRGTPMWGFDG